MTDYQELSLLDLAPHLEKSIEEKNFDTMILINERVSLIIKEKGVSTEDLESNKEGYQKLYELIRKAESLVKEYQSEISSIQSKVNKNRKSTKSYRDVGKL